MLPARIRRLRPDVFVMALTGTVAIATLLPCQGTSARIFHAAGMAPSQRCSSCKARGCRARRSSPA